MLPKDRKDRESRRKEQQVLEQATLDPHLAEPVHVVKYSDIAFRNAAVEWLIATDQVRDIVLMP